MDIHITMELESREDTQGGTRLATERVNQNVDLAVLVLAEDVINVISVEVISSDETFQVKM